MEITSRQEDGASEAQADDAKPEPAGAPHRAPGTGAPGTAPPLAVNEGAFSLASLRELLFGCLDLAAPSSVVEVGAFRGELTRELLAWASAREARVLAVEPAPGSELRELAEHHPELELVEKPSHEGLREIELPEAVILDGDHNYYTVSGELRILAERAPETRFPLVLMHDVGWPHARRDAYYAPERIPEEHRQPLAHQITVAPGEPGSAEVGIHYEWAAEREGGPRNGVLTAIEDFLANRDDLRHAIVPAFFGFGVIWSPAAPWADSVAKLLGPWDRNPLLERLENDRVAYLVERRQLMALRRRVAHLEKHFNLVHEQHRRQSELLTRMVSSRAFAVAEWLSRANQRGKPMFSREEIRRALKR